MFCTNCGNEINDGALFCTKCGNKIVNNNDNNGLIGKSIGNTEINNCYYSYGKSITKINLTNTEEKI